MFIKLYKINIIYGLSRLHMNFCTTISVVANRSLYFKLKMMLDEADVVYSVCVCKLFTASCCSF